MHSIVLLDQYTSNRIAAGEVVANPASVVKELVENAIDAGSSRISVQVECGGKKTIKVTDNGAGMSRKDLELCFKRHATSKIRSAEDLFDVRTMGFRGEALASIAAVSKVTIFTRLKEHTEGYLVEVEGGNAKEVTPVGCAEGTTVVVKDLFYNTPARRKFLKHDSQEVSQISEVMSRFALGFPNISLSFENEKRKNFETQGNGKLIDSIVSVFGLETAKNLVRVKDSDNRWHVEGYVSKPFFTKSSRKYQQVFVNSRWIKNKSLKHFLDHAYYTLLPKGRYPFAVLFIETTNTLVDVNVDPTKDTVRIEDEKELVRFLTEAVRKSLYSKREIQGNLPYKEEKVNQQEELKQDETSEQLEFSPEIYDEPLTKKNTSNASETNISVTETNVKETVNDYAFSSGLRIIGQLDSSYILCENDKDLHIIDQHAAHERVIYENILKQQDIQGGQLLVPKTIEVGASGMIILENFEDKFKEVGVLFDFFGGNSIVLREMPIGVYGVSYDQVFLDIMDDISDGERLQSLSTETLRISISCKAAIKAGQSLSKMEMEQLVSDLSQVENPLTCPHGRPTTIQISSRKLMKDFKRI